MKFFTVFHSLMTKVKSWIFSNKLEFTILIFILLIGAFLRLYKIDQYMTFLGDEGRDVVLVRRLLVDFDPILVGPGTSIGNMYLGPIYYYMMAPFLLLFNFSPVGPAVMIALLGVATIFFVWYVAREWFGKVAAPIASLLYATAPIVIIYSRSSWNPNIMPAFALLSIFSVWQFWEKRNYKWLVVCGISMAFVLQSHYLGLLLIPTIGFFWLLSLLNLRKDTRYKKNEVKKFLSYTLYAAILFLVLMSPLILFDARHGWRNFAAMKTFFTARQTTVSARPWTAIPKLKDLAEKISARLITATNEKVSSYALLGLLASFLWVVIFRLRKINKNEKKAYLLLSVWIVIALIGLGVYKQEIYDHYYGFFFAAPLLLIGGVSQQIVKHYKKGGMALIALFTSGLVYLNLINSPIRNVPNRQLQRSIAVSQKIIEEAKGEKFNIAVIAERNYEGAYQYFLEKEGAPIVIIDPQRYEETLTKQLFVVCELPHEKCDPVNNPKAEIANFGWSKVEDTWEVEGVLLYKLGHTQ